MDVFAVIVTCNAMRWVERSVSSLYASSCPPRHVIAVDNASSDGTPEHVHDCFPEVELVRMESNLGFASAAQAGIDAAVASGAEAVLLMHHDVWLEHDTLEILVKACGDDSLLVPVYLNGPGSDYETSFRPLIRRSSDLKCVLKRKTGQSFAKIPVSAAPSGCWLLPLSLLKETGPFNRLFLEATAACEEYLARMRYLSKKTYVVPGAKIFHDRDSYGDRTLFDMSSVYRDLMLIECNPGKGGLGRTVARIAMFFRLALGTVHYRVNLLKVFFKDLRKVRAVRPSLKRKREGYRRSGV